MYIWSYGKDANISDIWRPLQPNKFIHLLQKAITAISQGILVIILQSRSSKQIVINANNYYND